MPVACSSQCMGFWLSHCQQCQSFGEHNGERCLGATEWLCARMMEETTGGWGRMGGGMLTLQGGLIVFIINNGVFFFPSPSEMLFLDRTQREGGEGSPRGVVGWESEGWERTGGD